jgi:hypothetical protein
MEHENLDTYRLFNTKALTLTAYSTLKPSHLPPIQH